MRAEAMTAGLHDVDLKLDLEPDAADEPSDAVSSPEVPEEAPGVAATHRESGLTLSRLLHGLGGLVVVLAFVLYLFQGWRDGDDLTRCLLLLIHTVVLTMAGFASGHLLREAKGARLLIALALAAVPVSFAFLGGVTYPHLTWDDTQTLGTAAQFLGPAPGDALALGQALLLSGAAVAILAGSVWIGFLVMVRRLAGPLTVLYLLANAALLVPTRDEMAISVLLLILAGVGVTASLRLGRRDSSLDTPEGRFALAVLTLPLFVIAGRSLWLYAPDALFFATLSLVGYLGVRLAVRPPRDPSRRQGLIEATAVLLGTSTTLFLFAALVEIEGLAEPMRLPIAMGVLVLLLLDLSRHSAWPRRYRSVSASLAGLTMLTNLMLFGGFLSALACLCVSLVVLAYGFAGKGRAIFGLGMAGVLSGLGVMAHTALASFTVSGWSGLVVLGVATIVAGSLLERHGARVRSVLDRWSQHFRETA